MYTPQFGQDDGHIQFGGDWDSLLILNLFVLLMSFFSCDWILLTFLIGRLQAGWKVGTQLPRSAIPWVSGR